MALQKLRTLEYANKPNEDLEYLEDTYQYIVKVYDGIDKLLPHKKIYYISEHALYKLEMFLT